MVMSTVMIFQDATVVVCVTMCPHCHHSAIMEVPLETQLATITSLVEMFDFEIELMIQTWES